MKSIFLSHSSKDKDFVRSLAEDLTSAGVQVWLDEAELHVGDSLVDKIGRAVNEMDYLGVVLSQSSISSEWVRREVEIALNHEIRGKQVKVLPILKEPCDIPPFLIGKVYADFSKPELYQPALSKLLHGLGVGGKTITQVLSIDSQFLTLQAALSNGNFRVADAETRTLILRTLDRAQGLSKTDFSKLPCDALRTIDNLWLRYSHGRFGFSIQMRLAESFDTAEEFAATIGWRTNNAWITYSEAVFDISAPQGHLPICGEHGLLEFDEAMSEVGWMYGAKEYAKKEFSEFFSKGPWQFLRRVITDSEPVALSHQWLASSTFVYSRLIDCTTVEKPPAAQLVGNMTVAAVRIAVAEMQDKIALRKMLTDEQRARNRTGVVEAIRKRIRRL